MGLRTPTWHILCQVAEVGQRGCGSLGGGRVPEGRRVRTGREGARWAGYFLRARTNLERAQPVVTITGMETASSAMRFGSNWALPSVVT